MIRILILIPTLNRPGKLRALAENALGATAEASAVMYIAEPGDAATREAVTALGDEGLAMLEINTRKPCYAGAVNSGYASAVMTTEFTHVFIAADDVFFYPDWDTAALDALAARPGLRVSGTNDLHSEDVLNGIGSSHYLVDRRYIDEAGGVADQPPGIVQCELYGHGYTDSEFVDTASARGVWTTCLNSFVEHCHPHYGRSEWDDGYRKSMDPERIAADEDIFRSRQRQGMFRRVWAGPHA